MRKCCRGNRHLCQQSCALFLFADFLEGATALRPAASMSIDFFSIRRASEVAALDLSYVSADLSTGAVDIRVRRQKTDQFGLGQSAHIVSLPLREGACTVRLLSHWMWLKKWIADRRDHACRLASVDARMPLYLGLAQARFGLCMAASGTSAPLKKVLGGQTCSLVRVVPCCT